MGIALANSPEVIITLLVLRVLPLTFVSWCMGTVLTWIKSTPRLLYMGISSLLNYQPGWRLPRKTESWGLQASFLGLRMF
jgi:hypothetical protein